MKEKYLWAALIVILISWAGNYTYFQSKQLDEPIFLKHYSDSYYIKDGESMLTFYYLTNKQNPANVHYLRIDGHEFYPNNQGMSFHYDQEFRHHYLKSVMIPFPEHSLPISGDGTWTFESMEVGFDQYPPRTYDIGKVAFYPQQEAELPFDFRMSSGSSSHRSDTAFVATEKVTLEAIKIPFPEAADDLEVKLNLDQEKLKELDALQDGRDIPEWYDQSLHEDWNKIDGVIANDDFFPYSIEKDEWLRMMIYFNPERTSAFEFSLNLQGTTENGERFNIMAPINDFPSLEQKDVDELVDQQGGAY
ncbi:hypothetical protein [Mesobacillus harenae]|uniref:hypothetical protein n=1 Tax=Mesobacillus harenae TaxID=2213203 RepID=UPI001580F6CA|nr:hypothetical protein [Mesobacillus harenae]